MGYIEEQAGDLIDLYYEQANVFSGVIGILGIKALHSFSPYKRHKHPDVAQQRFPDLSLGGKVNPPPMQALESKGSIRSWALQSHYKQPGWYIVWRYAVDPTRRMKVGRPVIVWRIDLPFLSKADWKYEGSTAQEGRGGKNPHIRSEEREKEAAGVHCVPSSGGGPFRRRSDLD
jgi:hypothetical protein